MKPIKILLSVGLIALGSYAHSNDVDENVLLFERTNTHVISKGYRALSQEADTFKAQADHCKAKASSEVLAELQTSWQAFMAAWQSVQWVKFGPITAETRDWRLQFWPDPKNIIGRKMKALLKAPQITSLELEAASAIAQGLPSLEYLLYDPKAANSATAEKRCEAVRQIAASLQQLTSRLDQDWDAYQQEQRAIFQKSDSHSHSAVVALINSYAQQLNHIADQKLGKPLALGESNTRVNPYFLESWRSENSYENLKNNLNSITVFFEQGGLKAHLRAIGHKDLAEKLEKLLTQLNKVLPEYAFSFGKVKSDVAATQEKTRPLYKAFDELRAVVNVELSKALKVRLSFNASDGDS